MSMIDDIAKKTIEEISAELAQIGGAHDEFMRLGSKIASKNDSTHTAIPSQESRDHLPGLQAGSTQGFVDISRDDKSFYANQQRAPKEPNLNQQPQPSTQNEELMTPEYLFLRNLKERIEVLFEGLGQTPSNELNSRLEITLKFLEFLLATVHNRLENLSK